MDFDECDYLEKTIEGGDNQNGVSKKKDGAAEKSERSYRKRDGSVNGAGDVDNIDVDVDVRKHKRSRGADDDKDRHRSSRDKDRDEVRRERDGDKDGRRRERDGDKELERERRREKDRDRDLERERRHGRRRERDNDKEFEGEKRKENDGDKESEREKDVERDRKDSGRRERNGDKDLERDRKNNGSKDGDDDKEVARDRKDSGRREKDGDRDRSRERRSREKDRGREREREKDGEKEKEKERLGDVEKEKERRDREKREQEKSVEKKREREKDERSRRSRSRSMSRRHEVDLDREREFEPRESRRMKEKKEAVEPEVDPERDQRTVFAYQMPLKANERDVYDFFSKAGKVRDVRLIMDRNSRRSKGVGYIEFYDAMYVPMAIALSGHLLHGQPVMVKPSEAEKNLVQSTATGGVTSGVTGPYGPVDRKLYVGNLHFNMTELQLRQIFEPFGAVELVQLPLDLETGHCKGFGFIQFTQVEHAKAAQSLNGKLEIAGRVIKVSCVTDHVGVQDTGVKSADFDDDDGGGLALNAHSRALLMQKLDRTGVASSITGAFGNPMLSGVAQSQLPFSMSGNGQVLLPGPPVAAQVFAPPVSEPVGNPSECLLLKNMFDPASEAVPDFDLAIKEEVEEECSNFGRVMHIHVEKNSAGFVYLRFETVEAALKAQQTMHMRWYACRLISALFMQPFEYEAKFNAGS